MTTNEHISEGELVAMTRDLDQMHHDKAMPAMKSAISEWVESIKESRRGATPRAASRRTFLLGGAGLGASAAVLAACSSTAPSASSSSTTVGSTATTGGAGALTGDQAVAATAASQENLGVYAYKAAISAVQAGKLSVPAAVANFAMTAMQQHTDHAAAWNSALTAAGKTPVTATDPALTPTVNTAFGKVTNAAQLAQLALLVETIAAQTYQAAIPALSASSSVAVAATIHPVEMQHAAILYYVLGQYPGIQGTASNMYASGSPLAFSPTDLARSASDYSGS